MGMRHARHRLSVAAVAMLLVACGGGQNISPATAPAGSSTPPIVPTATSGGAASIGPVVLYAEHAPASNSRGANIVQYDLSTQRRLSSFEVGTSLEDDVQQTVAGDGRVIVNLRDRIVSYAYDGSDARELRHAQPGGAFIGIAISPNLSKLALMEQTGYQCPTPAPTPVEGLLCRDYRDITQAVVIDASSGHEVLTVRQVDPRLVVYYGQLALPSWRQDGTGFVVSGYTYSEAPGGLATLILDGTVRLDRPAAWMNLAPDGHHAVDMQGEISSLSEPIVRHGVAIIDLDSEATLGSVADPALNFDPTEWSPDGKEFLYSTYRLVDRSDQPGSRMPDESTRTWHVLLADGSSTRDESDLYAARRRWYGSRVVEYRCQGQLVPSATDQCYGPSQLLPLSISIGGVHIDDAINFRLIAFLDM
jgi:hypothetical protein